MGTYKLIDDAYAIGIPIVHGAYIPHFEELLRAAVKTSLYIGLVKSPLTILIDTTTRQQSRQQHHSDSDTALLCNLERTLNHKLRSFFPKTLYKKWKHFSGNTTRREAEEPQSPT